EERNEATMKLDSVYDEIRPAIEELVKNVICPRVTNEPNPGPENSIDCLKSQ
ncbi:hypothetical protein Tco_1461290, partial [Tanacetum coccineum]